MQCSPAMSASGHPSSPDAQKLVIGASCPFPALPPPVAVSLTVLPEHPCSYLPDRLAQTRALWCGAMDGDIYHGFMDAGFRRSGKLVYQPVCRGCRECMPIRVPAGRFAPSKSQRRSWKKNQDLVVAIGPPRATDEKFELYRRYATQWHSSQVDDRSSFEQFLYESPVQTLEFSYRLPDGKLAAVGICDVCDASLSSVYFYFDPAEAHRGLGTFGALYEIDFTVDRGIPYYYLGYWIRACRTMQYKSSFRPFELLHPDGVWRGQEGGPG
jgi:arginyl-tRNA--protein-N-Asp/Glu arginylyltransferase